MIQSYHEVWISLRGQVRRAAHWSAVTGAEWIHPAQQSHHHGSRQADGGILVPAVREPSGADGEKGEERVTIRISLRLNKVDAPKLRWLFLIACLQILFGILSIGIETILGLTQGESLIVCCATPLGATLLSGLLLTKLLIKADWKRTLRVWSLASILQMVLLPVCSAAFYVIYMMLLSSFPNLTPWQV
jgi:hypothetical protein